MSFKDFIPRYIDGTIYGDMTYRTYNIERMADAPIKLKRALKALGYERTDHVYDQIAADYALMHAMQAKQLLALWWTWHEISTGLIRRAVLR